MIKVRIWTKDAAEPIEFIAQSISFIGGFVVLTEDIAFSTYVPIGMIRLMERTAIREPTNEIPEAFGDPVRSGTLIEPEGKKQTKKEKK